MKKLIFNTLFSFLISTFSAYAQPYVVNEQLEKIFSEGFTDVNSSFPITSSSDPKFWASYGDGYYYMERKITSPRAIIADFKAISKNLAIKTKIQLGPVRSSESSVGVMFLVQPKGKGGFLFEINGKKSFRIKDLSNGAFITKEGENGWIKSKAIAPATRNNTIEIKGFRGKFDIYINSLYLYSFINNSYQSGKSGVYLGQNASARMYYFNLYELKIPGAPIEVNLKNLQRENLLLKEENDSLKTIEIQTRFGENNEGMISAIKILEQRIISVNEENSKLNQTLKEYENSQLSLESKEAEKTSNTASEKISSLSSVQDSLRVNNEKLNLKLTSTQKEKDSMQSERDSLRINNEKLNIKLTSTQKEKDSVQSERDSSRVNDEKLNIKLTSTQKEKDSVQSERDSLRVNNEKLNLKLTSTQKEKDSVQSERDSSRVNDEKLNLKLTSTQKEKDSVQSERDSIRLNNEKLNLRLASTQKEKDSVQSERDSIRVNNKKLNLKLTSTQKEKDSVQSERDSIRVNNEELNLKLTSTQKEKDSMQLAFEQMKSKIKFLESHMVEVQEEILKIKSHEKEALVKEPSLPSAAPMSPKFPSSIDENLDNTQDITNGAELLKADSTYEHTIDIDEEIGFENNDKEDGLLDEEIPSLTPLKSQVIKVKKAVKAELKD